MDVGENQARRIYLFDVRGTDDPVPVTTDRLDSYSPAFGAGGKWLYFLSDRTFRSVQGSPWGARQPEALLDKTTSVFLLDLVGEQRSPFAPDDELTAARKEPPPKPAGEGVKEGKKEAPKAVEVKLEGLSERLHAAPLEPGNYSYLSVAKGSLYFFRS
ncbi:MAG: Tricorn protease-like protein, partial [Akkermansiaceae bacterium]|nr:Tricorn protease-like protein [Akkermansiaceae bacterium]